MNELDKLIKELIKEKGGTKEQYLHLLNSIAKHETQGSLSPTQKQIGGGPGRGKYQFEIGKNKGAITAARRLKRYYENNGTPVPQWLKQSTSNNSLDVSNLTGEQQDLLFLGNMREHPRADLGKVVNGEESVPEFWANYHWSGPKRHRQTRLKSFNSTYKELINDNDKEIIPLENFPQQEKDAVLVKQPIIKKPVGVLTKQQFAMGGSLKSSLLQDPPVKNKKYSTEKDAPYNKFGYIEPERKFLLDYLDSPMFEKRLKNSQYDVEKEKLKRKRNIEDTYIMYSNDDTDSGTDKAFSHFNPFINRVMVNNKQSQKLGTTTSEVTSHELGHSEILGDFLDETQSFSYDDIKFSGNRLNSKERIQLESMLNNPNANSHDIIPGENKSDINALRYNLFKDGIYDAGKEEFTRDHLKKAKKSFTLDRLLKNYGEDNLILLMNIIAQNNSTTDNRKVAAYGGQVNTSSIHNNSFTEFNEGGAHESNSLGGIPLGQNASVEQGESSYNFKDKGKYIFSNRIDLDGNIQSDNNIAYFNRKNK